MRDDQKIYGVYLAVLAVIVVGFIVIASILSGCAPTAPELEDPMAPPSASLEIFHNKAEREEGVTRAADNSAGHVCMSFGYGFCATCMSNKNAKQDSVCAPPPWGWGSYNPVPMFGQPATRNQ